LFLNKIIYFLQNYFEIIKIILKKHFSPDRIYTQLNGNSFPDINSKTEIKGRRNQFYGCNIFKM